ncbi:MAG: outer membrane beta-barrel protein [Pseudomonadota bacterium]
MFPHAYRVHRLALLCFAAPPLAVVLSAPTRGASLDELLGAAKLSGFVSTSFVYDFNRPASDKIAGRSFDINHADFAINKLELELEKPAAFSGESWDVGYQAHVIFGQDAQLIQSAGFDLGTNGDVHSLNLTVNVPVGRGLQISAGKWVTLMGVELIQETRNPNWSEGNQFLLVENFTSTGVQLSYQFSDRLEAQFRVFNGWDVVKDNNGALSFMGRVGYTPDDATSLSLVVYGGPEQADDTSAWRSGVNLVVSRALTPELTLWLQGDYGHEQRNAALPDPTKDAEWWAGGLWLSYDFSSAAGLALRGDYVDDRDGARTSAAPFTAPFPVNDGQKLSSLTLTLNLRPVDNLQLRPELRWDHSSARLFESRAGIFDRANRVSLGVGLAYLF